MDHPGCCRPRSCQPAASRQGESHRLWVAHEQTGPKDVPGPEAASDTAARVLRIEGEAVLRHGRGPAEGFRRRGRRDPRDTRGRVILGGIGKSGHIARKISSTLASTGTPSAFVHPAEASHGDLGMIMPGDLVILISNSGETSELRDIVAHVARFSIPLIGISGKDSTLMQAADYRLTLPSAPEACALGMAPTTSTTLTLALGDALAVAVMERRGFLPNSSGRSTPAANSARACRRYRS
jgi:arabinose-5-phosphate isomerase